MRTENIPSAKTAESIGMNLVEKYTDDDGVEISVYAIERMKNEQIIRHRRSCRKLSTG